MQARISSFFLGTINSDDSEVTNPVKWKTYRPLTGALKIPETDDKHSSVLGESFVDLIWSWFSPGWVKVSSWFRLFLVLCQSLFYLGFCCLST